MSSTIEQAYNKAVTEYDEVKTRLKRLEDLKRGDVQEDWAGERAELEKERDELKMRRDKWEVKLQEWGDKLPATTQPGDNFVIRALGT